MTKAKLIQLIHIAKRQLGLDDETYRSVLNGVSGKASCSNMSIGELTQVLEHFKKLGFKTRVKRRLSPQSHANANLLGEISKIRAVWITMYKQGLLEDGSETALDSYVNRMLNRAKIGLTVSYTAQFLTYQQAIQVLEPLKKWHKRAMLTYLKKHEVKTYEPYFDEIASTVFLKPISLQTAGSKSYAALTKIFDVSKKEADVNG